MLQSWVNRNSQGKKEELVLRLVEAAAGGANERDLFHGTDDAAVQPILSGGKSFPLRF